MLLGGINEGNSQICLSIYDFTLFANFFLKALW